MLYTHSPKAIVVAGAPASGKSTVARRIAETFGSVVLPLDEVNARIASRLGIAIDGLRQPHPAIIKEFKTEFLHACQANRFENLVLEGCRISHPHIFAAFHHALFTAYGEYVMLKCFYLHPDSATREKQYLLRKLQFAKKAIRDKDKGALGALQHQQEKGFTEQLDPPLPGFEVVTDMDAILDYAAATQGRKHPRLPAEFEGLIKAIAESGTHNPFYQRVEVGGKVVFHGFTESEKTWDNILKLGIDFRGKHVCDIGCMHGYFSFKMEEAGAIPHGIDVDPRAIAVAQRIAMERHSAGSFAAVRSEAPFDRRFDYIFALNVLHRVTDFETSCRNIFAATDNAVLEVGEVQLKDIFLLSKDYGFKMRKTLKSHRNTDVVGQRAILHLAKA